MDSRMDRAYTLDELEALTGIPERTIRSYIARGVLPPPSGRGRGSNYTEEHRIRLMFLRAVREATPFELPLDLVARLLRELPWSQIERIADGREAVHAEFLPGVDPALLRRKRGGADTMEARSPSAARPSSPDPLPILRDEVPDALYASREFRSEMVTDEVWSSIDVTPRLRLSMKGSADEARDELIRLARRLRAWLE